MAGEEEKKEDSAETRPSRAPSSLENRVSGTVPPPSTPPKGHNLRIVFAFVWVIVQLTLIITADRRVDGAFGFRMFPESSWIKVALYREVDVDGVDRAAQPQRTRIHVENGVWTAKDARGRLQQLNWYDRVPMPFWVFDKDMPASYGAATQLARLQAALDDVATHSPDDDETHRLILEVTVHRNGREAVVHELTSRERVVLSSGAQSP